MFQGKITVVGLGPGSQDDITPAAAKAVREADTVIGYRFYFQFIRHLLRPETECLDTGMRQEEDRARAAVVKAAGGQNVCIISSGDAGIYGMAPLIWEICHREGISIPVETIPGISAFQKAAALLGAPIGHDLCLISLSDLMTPWPVIEKRIRAAAEADFVTAVYNPVSRERYWQLYRLIEIFLKYRKSDTPVGYVRQAGRPGQELTLTSLALLNPEDIDMLTVIIIGNSQSFVSEGHLITPRGYFRKNNAESRNDSPGRQIMQESFRTIAGELRNPEISLERKWLLLHAIHTTADFEMENLVWMSPAAVATIYGRIRSGQIRTIVTDVTMAAAGIRKGALERLGVEVRCCLNEPETEDLAGRERITRAQAGIRTAVSKYPGALFVFGNAPTALMELCRLVRSGKAAPGGIIAAPVGFVHVEESKQMAKPLDGIPRIIIEGRKGGSNLAATLTNAVLTYDDAAGFNPGRDL